MAVMLFRLFGGPRTLGRFYRLKKHDQKALYLKFELVSA